MGSPNTTELRGVFVLLTSIIIMVCPASRRKLLEKVSSRQTCGQAPAITKPEVSGRLYSEYNTPRPPAMPMN